MTYSGKTHDFLGDVLPDEDYRLDIFRLVVSAWPKVKLPRGIRLEPRITGLLRLAMVGEQETIFEPDPPFFITEEVKKRDPLKGKEFERTDVEIHLRHSYIRGQKPYFVFESKRLNVSYGTAVRSEAHAYVAEGGMGHLLAGGYESVPNFNGMLAYVMDGQLAKAKDAVEKQLASKSGELQLVGEAKIHSSKLMPAGSPHGETRHVKGAEEFKLFHLFLAV